QAMFTERAEIERPMEMAMNMGSVNRRTLRGDRFHLLQCSLFSIRATSRQHVPASLVYRRSRSRNIGRGLKMKTTSALAFSSLVILAVQGFCQTKPPTDNS